MNIQTIAKRYAVALHSQAKDMNEKADIWEQLSDIANIQKTDKDFNEMIRNPLISVEDKKAVFTALYKSKKIGKLLYEFLVLLAIKRRLFLISEINDEIHLMILADRGELEVEATFAEKADESVKSEIEKKLSKLVNKKIVLKEFTDPKVLGGVKLLCGSILYDASVKGQLDKLKASLL